MGPRPTTLRREPVEVVTWNQLEHTFDQLVSEASEIYGPEGKNTEVMDRQLFNCLKTGNSGAFIELLRHSVQDGQPLSAFLNNSSPNGNTVLHLAAGSPSADIVKLLVRFPDLLDRTNSQGDTPLHDSARTGNIEATIVLVKCTQEYSAEVFLKKKNKKGNTALHNAVIMKHHGVAECLIKADPIAAYLQNEEVKSPLYLAAQNGDSIMLRIIMQAVPENEYPIRLLQGKSPANAAIESRNLDMLRDMASMKPELLRHKDEKEEIPLHFASRIGYFEGVEFLLEKGSDDAFERNKKGLYPIHVACRNGHINVMDRLLKEWPDPMELVTRNGQSILHVSAEKGREDVVDHLLKNPEIVKLINEKDEDGNTALHLATMRGRSLAVYSLVMSKKVDWKIFNNENMAPYQVVEQQIKRLEEDAKDEKLDTKLEEKETKQKQNQLQLLNYNEVDEKLDTKLQEKETKQKQNQLQRLNYYEVMMTSAILHFHGSRPKGIRDYMRIPSKPLTKEDIKGRIENLLVVAILVASVTFAGAIQIPGNKSGGGGDSDAVGPPSPTASKDDALLKVYIYLDVMALNAAIMASLILCWAKITTHLVWLASILIGLSIYLMCLAFVFAAAIAVSQSVVTFSVLLLVSSILFLLQTIFCLPLIIPPNESKAVEKFLSPYIYYGIFEVYLLFEKSIAKLPHNNNNHHRRHHHHKK